MAILPVQAKIQGDGVALAQWGRAIKFLMKACKDTASAATDEDLDRALVGH